MFFEMLVESAAITYSKPSSGGADPVRAAPSRKTLVGRYRCGRRSSGSSKARTTLRWLCGDNFYLHEGTLLIEHAPGTAFPTAEIDHLAITPFGVFIFETKNWSGRIAPSTCSGNLTRTAPERSGGRMTLAYRTEPQQDPFPPRPTCLRCGRSLARVYSCRQRSCLHPELTC